jgi:hypothetical protein
MMFLVLRCSKCAVNYDKMNCCEQAMQQSSSRTEESEPLQHRIQIVEMAYIPMYAAPDVSEVKMYVEYISVRWRCGDLLKFASHSLTNYEAIAIGQTIFLKVISCTRVQRHQFTLNAHFSI